MISEKDKKIVAAVFASRGFVHEMDDKVFNLIGRCKIAHERYEVGDYSAINNSASDEYWEVICTIEEYNQCIEDMARADWMCNLGCHGYQIHLFTCKINHIDTSNKELLKENCDYSFYDKPLVYTQDMKDAGKPIKQGMQFKNSDGVLLTALLIGKTTVGYLDEDGDVDSIWKENIHPIKTLEQIKQDKLDAHIQAVAQAICTEYCKATDLYNKTWEHFKGEAVALYNTGYIVEPK